MSRAYAYRAWRADGQEVKDTIVAGGAEEVREYLTSRGLIAIEVKAHSRAINLSIGGGRLRLGHLVDLFRDLATSQESGAPLAESFAKLARPERTKDQKLREMYADITARLQSGTPLSEALAAYPKIFTETMLSFVRAGEETGDMENSLRRLAGSLNRRRTIRNKVITQMSYPMMTGAIVGLIIVAIFMFMLPTFATLYDELGSELPMMTQVAIGISDFLRGWWFLWVPLALIIPYGLIRVYKTNDQFAVRVEKILYRIPMIGKIAHSLVIFNWAESLETALPVGTRVADAVHMAATNSGSRWMRIASKQIVGDLQRGRSLQRTLLDHKGLFPFTVTDLVETGERTGTLPDQFRLLARDHQETVEMKVEQASKLIEPLMLVVMGGAIGTVMIAIYLPIFGLSEAIGNTAMTFINWVV